MIDLVTVKEVAVRIYCLQAEQTIMQVRLYEMITSVAIIRREPGAERRVQRRPGAASDVIDDATILRRRTGTIEDGTTPLVVVIVPIKDDIHTVGLKDGHQLSLHFGCTTVDTRAVGRMVEKDKLPGLGAGL